MAGADGQKIWLTSNSDGVKEKGRTGSEHLSPSMQYSTPSTATRPYLPPMSVATGSLTGMIC